MTFQTLDNIQFLDLKPDISSFYHDVIHGFSKNQKSISPKYFYDLKGSELFHRICHLPEYYPTRTELQIMHRNIQDITSCIGDDSLIIELGSGVSEKIRLLLQHLQASSYLAIDISKEFLIESTKTLAREFEFVNVYALCADFTRFNYLTTVSTMPRKKIVYFPGSTIGNFTREEAEKHVKQFYSLLDKGDGFLVGIDLMKDLDILIPAYNDSMGITADFNKNLLTRMNNELDATIEPDTFDHCIQFNANEKRIEMHLKSNIKQRVTIANYQFSFKKGETIHTENSYKYYCEEIDQLFTNNGFNYVKRWCDDAFWFSINYFEK